MTAIGIMPTRTSVQLATREGMGSLPAATPRAAGCMAADDKERLDTLWGVHQTGGGTVTLIERPAQPVDAVTRAELRQMLNEVQKRIAAPVIVHQPSGPDVNLDDIYRQIDDIRQRHATLAGIVSSILDSIETAQGAIERVQTDQRFIEANAVAQVGVT